MQLVAILLLGCLCLASAQEENQKPEGCGECDRNACPKLDPKECVGGITRDVCECCQVCSQKLDDPCDFEGSPRKFGSCGKNMECRPNKAGSGQCSCIHTEEICGSNNVTYKNLCQLMEDSIKTGDLSLIVRSMGPCETAPKILTAPENKRNKTGGSVNIGCEVTGVPLPQIAWSFTRANGESITLPSDDVTVSVVSRGGPEKKQVTGWLQVMNLTEHHEGDYTCMAQNKYGLAQAVARVKVMGPQDENTGPRRGDMVDPYL